MSLLEMMSVHRHWSRFQKLCITFAGGLRTDATGNHSFIFLRRMGAGNSQSLKLFWNVWFDMKFAFWLMLFEVPILRQHRTRTKLSMSCSLPDFSESNMTLQTSLATCKWWAAALDATSIPNMVLMCWCWSSALQVIVSCRNCRSWPFPLLGGPVWRQGFQQSHWV